MIVVTFLMLFVGLSWGDDAAGNSSAIDWNNPAQQTTTPDILEPAPPLNFVPKYSRPVIAPGALPPDVLPYDTTRGNVSLNIYSSGITFHLLAVAQTAWVQLMPIVAAAAYVPLSQAPEVFIRQAIYTLLLWHPEYMPLYNVDDAEDIWTDPSLNARMVHLGNELNWQFTNLTVYESLNKTANLYKLLDDSAYKKYKESVESGLAYYNMPYFAWLVDAELAASEFFLGNALSDEAYSAFTKVFEFINHKVFFYIDSYTLQCLRRYTRSRLFDVGQKFKHQ
jgi:hypothetical protein